uniref:Transmembrane protein 208 n=1 Tax=Parascaris univalens TaxID=6257 RepID=A0A915BG13_PARUN
MNITQRVGKMATKGQKRIYEENMYVIRDYGIAAAFSSIFYASLSLTVFSPTAVEWTVFCVCALLQLGAMLTMRYMAQSIRNEKGQVVDAGIDLNQPDAFGEYCKDVVILCSCVTVIATFWSNIFWLLLLIPGYACYKLWTGILAPWFFAQPDTEEMDEKKLRKKERKLRKI